MCYGEGGAILLSSLDFVFIEEFSGILCLAESIKHFSSLLQYEFLFLSLQEESLGINVSSWVNVDKFLYVHDNSIFSYIK